MVNKLYIDQIAYKMNRAEKGVYEDVSKATESLKWIVEKIESYLNKCVNVENGICNLTWKHEDCKVLMEILYEITQDNKYKEKEWLFDPNKQLLWD
jgi:hypothetical protein